jgi:hypothetical protein
MTTAGSIRSADREVAGSWVAVLVVDAATAQVCHVDERALSLTGATPLPIGVGEWLAAAGLEDVRPDDLLSEGARGVVVRAAGRERAMELVTTRVPRDGADLVVATFVDTSDHGTRRREDGSRPTAYEAALEAANRRYRQLAAALQQSLLPAALPVVPGLDLGWSYHAAAAGLDVGGDFYDVFQRTDTDWAAVIGDVMGKGAEAASVTAAARYTLRAAAMRARKPSVVLAQLNEALLADSEDRPFLTVAYVDLRPHPGGLHAVVALAGHPPPLVLRVDGSVDVVGEPGVLVGVVPDLEVVDVDTDLRPGEALVLYTDGITEARRGGMLFGEAGLRAVLRECAGRTAGEICDAVTSAAVAFEETAPDDRAVLVVRATPA